MKGGHFVTVLLLRVDTGGKSLSYASAGHIPGFVMGSSGDVEAALESSGLPLGVFHDAEFTATSVRPTMGATVLLLTDGISEMISPDGSQLGLERVLEFVRSHRDQRARHIVEGICCAAKQFGRTEHRDDLAAIVMKRTEIPQLCGQ